MYIRTGYEHGANVRISTYFWLNTKLTFWIRTVYVQIRTTWFTDVVIYLSCSVNACFVADNLPYLNDKMDFNSPENFNSYEFDDFNLPSVKALRDLEQLTDDAAFTELLGRLL